MHTDFPYAHLTVMYVCGVCVCVCGSIREGGVRVAGVGTDDTQRGRELLVRFVITEINYITRTV